MKKMILGTVLSLVMFSPALAVDVHSQADSWLVASTQTEQPAPRPPKKVIIKGKGGKVTDVEQGSGKKSKKKK
ncbi:hypothetical protein [uncultured Pseudodesulfovibrio sp.]|uniref:hypothetical protein n=1 Tax=uncultured Pseudodesulfovibrio sp. TaxID=2035858 RepID=UPI0029C88224|nr:hypothetical protein [uncultured Pseudodesulfovibrio sp.]